MFKKVLVLVLVVLMSFSVLAACSSPTSDDASDDTSADVSDDTSDAASGDDTSDDAASDDTSDDASGTAKSLDIVWVHMSPAAQSEQGAYDGFAKYVEDNGLDWKVTEVSSDGSGAIMASNIEDAVASGCDAIICSMADLQSSAAALETANAAGIPVFSIDSQYTPGVEVDITSNNYVMGAKVSSFLVDYLGGEGNITALTMVEHHGVRKRGNVFVDVILPEAQGITLLDNHNIDYGNFYADCQKTAEDWMSKYGDEIDAIWCGWDEPAMAASNAILAAGFTRDDIVVTGIDGHADALTAIRNGDPVIATVAQAFSLMGEKAAVIIDDMLCKGKSWDEAIGVQTIYIDAPLLTLYNCPAEGEVAYLAPDFYE